MRQLAKRVLENLACGSGITRLARRRMRAKTLVLAYHNIVPDGEPVAGDASLHLGQRTFGKQLDLLCQTHEVVTLREALRPERFESRPARPRAVLTFDDATQGALTAGVAELSRRGLPATVFVAPGFVGGRSFWWDSVVALTAERRDYCLTVLRGRDAEVRRWAAENGMALREVPAHQTCGTEAQLQAVVDQGIELGAHTWDHPNLTMLNGPELEEELSSPLEWLRARFGAVLPVLAYPYGLASSTVGVAAESTGYEAALRVQGGWLDRTSLNLYPFLLPRQNIPSGLSERGFKMLTSGL